MSPERVSLVEFAECNSYQLTDRASVPISYQLSRLCERYIYESHLKPGDRFPSEEAIAEGFKVSRPTAHRAIRELLTRGWLTRERGRGTFVASGSYVELTLLSGELSFSDQYAGKAQPSSHIIDLSEEPASREAATVLHLSEREPVYRLRRLRCIDEKPVFVEDSYLSVSRFPEFTSHDLVGGSLVATLRRFYATSIIRCVRRVEASEALGQEIADYLQIPILSPILIVHGEAYSEAGLPVIYMRAYVREGVSFQFIAHPCRSTTPRPNEF